MSKNPLFRSVAARYTHLKDEELHGMWMDKSRPASELKNLHAALWVRLWDTCEPVVRKRLSNSYRTGNARSVDQRANEALSNVMAQADTILGQWRPEQAKLVTRAYRWIIGAVSDLCDSEKTVHLPEGVRADLRTRSDLANTKESHYKAMVKCLREGRDTTELAESLKLTSDQLEELDTLAGLQANARPHTNDQAHDPLEELEERGKSAANLEAKMDLKRVLKTCKPVAVTVWRMITAGYSAREVGVRLGLSHVTASKHFAAVNAQIKALTL